MAETTVTPRFQREPDSVAGPFFVVKDACLICALPVQTAPANPAWDAGDCCGGGPDHCRILRQPETAAETEQVIGAMLGACTEVIQYCGTDPAILNRLRTAGRARLCDALQEGPSGPHGMRCWNPPG